MAVRDVDDFDPHQHRNLPKPTSNVETFIHLLKCSLGTGILAMPQAFSNAGMIPGIVGTILTGVILTHCLHVLIQSQYEACKRKRVGLITYPDTVKVAFESGPKSLRFYERVSACLVDVFLIVYQLGVGCVYILFVSGNNKKIIDPSYEMSLETHMLIILIPLILLNCIPNLKILAPFNLLANALQLFALILIVYCLLVARKPLPPGATRAPLDWWGSIWGFPLFFGTVLFALTAVGVVVSVENNMKTPKAFGGTFGVLNLAMIFIVALYTVFGAIGYVYCVSDCSDSITLDMPEGTIGTTVMVLIVLSIFISYALHCYVPVEILWRDYILPRLERNGASARKKLYAEYALRIGLCLLTFVLALSIPRLGLFISLFGALCLSALGICFPVLMELCFKYPSKLGPGRIILWKDIFLFIFGLVGLILGSVTAIYAIIVSFM